MSRDNCGMIKDLLPLYADDVCSDESREIVAEHIEKCSECRSELDKIGRNINVSVDRDIAVIKRIRRRIMIEKIVAGLVAVLSIIIVLFISAEWLAGYKQMMFDEEEIAENISIVTDDEGMLWLETKGYAQSYRNIITDIIDADGNHMFDDGFDRNSQKTFCVTLSKTRADEICDKIPDNFYSDLNDGKSFKRTRLFNVNAKNDIEKIVYYDYINDREECVIWERDVNE